MPLDHARLRSINPPRRAVPGPRPRRAHPPRPGRVTRGSPGLILAYRQPWSISFGAKCCCELQMRRADIEYPRWLKRNSRPLDLIRLFRECLRLFQDGHIARLLLVETMVEILGQVPAECLERVAHSTLRGGHLAADSVGDFLEFKPREFAQYKNLALLFGQ